MANEKEQRKDELTDKEAEKVVGGLKDYQSVIVKGTHCHWCGEPINGEAYLYKGQYYHPRHLPTNFM